MPITPQADKLSVISIIAADSYIASLGFTRDCILNTMNSDEKLIKGKKQIFVYNAGSIGGKTPLSVMPTIQIDVSVPVSESSVAGLCAEQIIALLNDKSINNHAAMQLVSPSPANLPCPFGFEVIGIRFQYDATIVNAVKTV